MKISSLSLSIFAVISMTLPFQAEARFQRIPFPDLVADSGFKEVAPGTAIKTQSDSGETSSTTKPSDFTVKLVPEHSKSAFKTVFKVEALDYTVQMSAFQTEEEAKGKVADLEKNKVADLWIMNAKVAGKTWYRVCAGHFKSKKIAASAQTQIAEKSGVKEAFVQKVIPRLTASNADAS